MNIINSMITIELIITVVCAIDGWIIHNIISKSMDYLNLLNLTPKLIMIIIMHNRCYFKYLKFLKTYKYIWLNYYYHE